MNILLVDDEEYVIEGMRQRVSFEKLGIDHIFTANNVRQAKEHFKKQKVDILVCDIRMPQEDGFSLLSWVRKAGYPVQVVFLTSYADFEYARQALTLGSLEYLLKPVDYKEMEAVLKKAVLKAAEWSIQREYEEKSIFWEESIAQLKEHFWESCVSGRINGKEDLEHGRKAVFEKLGYASSQKFFPVLFVSLTADGEIWEQDLVLFSVKNILEEMLAESCYTLEAAFIFEEKKIAAIIKAPMEETEGSIRQTFLSFTRYMDGHLGQNLWCGIGELEQPGQIFSQIEALQEMFSDTMAEGRKVFLLKEFEKRRMEYEMPPLALWNKLIKSHEEEALQKEVNQYLIQLNQKGKINQEVLKLFRLDMTQLVYAFLAASEVKAHRLFADKECDYLYRQAIFSIYDMEKFVQRFIKKALDYIRFTSKTKSVVDILTDYIDKNYEKDITRNELADIVYLNTDYISRLFKKEKGISISSYLMQKRLEVAKDLLGRSDMPINGVSLEVGYSNFSYFTKMFRDAEGMTPLEYRRSVRRKI